MSHDPIELERIQRWMQSVITHPDGIEAAIDSDAARREIDVTAQDVQRVITRSQALDSIERLRVYGNAYYARLLECLREEYPALVHAVGMETFDGFAFGYLQQYPSTSYTLAQLGRSFPKYLAETRPKREADQGGPDWADFLIDIARLERAYSEVFDGPGGEDERLLEADDLTAISPEHWPQARLIPVECLRLLTLSYPVHEYATAVRKHQQPAPPPPSPTYLAISRREYIVRRRAVSPQEFDVLQALADGHTVGQAIEKAASDSSDDKLDELAANLRQWFTRWAAAGYFRRLEVAE
jgi:hypothetical protein